MMLLVFVGLASFAQFGGSYSKKQADAKFVQVSDSVAGYTAAEIDAIDQSIKNSSKKLRALKAMGSSIKYLPIWDMQTGVGSSALTDGNVYTIKFYVDKADTITGVRAFMKTQGVFTGDNFNGAALFSVAGGVHTRVAISANDENFWKANANTACVIPFTSSVIIQPGLYVVNILYNASSASTAPQIGSDNAWGTNIQNFFGLTNTNRLSDTKASMTEIPSSYNSNDAGYSGNATLWSIALY